MRAGATTGPACSDPLLGGYAWSVSLSLSSSADIRLRFRIRGQADGMAFLHGIGIAHRDLKSPNILLDDVRCAPPRHRAPPLIDNQFTAQLCCHPCARLCVDFQGFSLRVCPCVRVSVLALRTCTSGSRTLGSR